MLTRNNSLQVGHCGAGGGADHGMALARLREREAQLLKLCYAGSYLAQAQLTNSFTASFTLLSIKCCQVVTQ